MLTGRSAARLLRWTRSALHKPDAILNMFVHHGTTRTDVAARVDAIDAAPQPVAGQQRPVEGVCAGRAGERGARLERLLGAAQRQQAVARGVLQQQDDSGWQQVSTVAPLLHVGGT